MTVRSSFVERAIPMLGGIKQLNEPVRSASGNLMNTKIELEEVFNSTRLPNRVCFRAASDELAANIAPYNPDLLVSVANGGNKLTNAMSSKLAVAAIETIKTTSSSGDSLLSIEPRHYDFIKTIGRVAIIDDVFSTGNSIKKVSQLLPAEARVVAAGVVWNRDDGTYANVLPFDIVSVVEKHIPFMREL